MRTEVNFEIFQRVFSARINVVSALQALFPVSRNTVAAFKHASKEFELAIFSIGAGEVEGRYREFSFSVGIFAQLAEWSLAVWEAEPEARRFLASAQLRVSTIDRVQSWATTKELESFLSAVSSISEVRDLEATAQILRTWALPLLLFSHDLVPDADRRAFFGLDGRAAQSQSEKLEAIVAFLRFDIDGQPAKQWNYLEPRTAYDLTIELRVSNWPTDAEVLTLLPITIDVRERDWLPKFHFAKPDAPGPHLLTATKRAVLEVAHSFGSRPYEFLYAAEFENSGARHPIAVVGHRRLLLEGSDVTSRPLTGFSNVDRHLLKIRDRLRSVSGIHLEDIANAMTILAGLGNILGCALRDGSFEARTLEKEFQAEVTKSLMSRPDIGEHLHSHPAAGGGITDLTFHEIPIELKVEVERPLGPKDFVQYFDQTAAYSIGFGKRIGVLSVLESSAKTSPLGNVEDDVEFFLHKTGDSFIAIVVVVIRGGFPRPSKYSR